MIVEAEYVPDIRFIAHARQDVPALLDEVEHLPKVETELIEFLGMMEPWYMDKSNKVSSGRIIVIKAFRDLLLLSNRFLNYSGLLLFLENAWYRLDLSVILLQKRPLRL
jgi:hypothetical protein